MNAAPDFPSFNTLRLERREHVVIVTLDRPDAMNAVNMQMLEDVRAAFEHLDDRPDVWVALVRGEGRAFSVGADLKERAGMSLQDVRRRRRLSPQAFAAISNCTKPVIAAVHGYALGGGFELALACDLIIASADAQIALPEVRLGIIPAGGGTQRLSRLIGPARAKELILTGRRFGAAQAEAWGIANRVVPADELLAIALALAEEMAASAPLALQQAKKAINAALDVDLRSGVLLEAEAYQTCLTSDDRQEGLAAFREKRPPRFTGS